MRGLATLVAVGAGLALAGAAPATPLLKVQKAALAAVHQAVASGQLDSATAAADRAEIGRAAYLVRVLPSGRSQHVAVALEEVAAFAGRLTHPRANALFGQLKVNDDYFAKHWAPADKTDITDSEGVVYRYFGGRCFEFHPLASFGALNAHVAAEDVDGTKLLADALAARGVYQRGGGIGWEYYFSFSGGRPPWLSGMAQAVAAQAFARAARLLPETSAVLLREAHAAYTLIPDRLLTRVAAGPWIRLYAFHSTPVLNAQLQTVISLESYATDAKDAAAGALAAQMQHAAAATLPKFDTGYWTYYALPNEPSPLDYQQFVVQLLKRLSSTDARFADAAKRFAAYQHQPPAFMLANGGLGALRFWLSKPSTVSAVTAAGPSKRVSLDGGWHTLSWNEPKRAGVYPLKLSAVDWAGNRASFESLPFVRVGAATPTSVVPPPTGTAPSAPPSFTVGTGLDDPAQSTLARSLGLRLVRLAVTWPAGAAAPDPSVVAPLATLPQGTGVVLELAATPLPADDAGREALAEYGTSLAQQVPGLREIVLDPAPTPSQAPLYAQALLSVRTAVQAAVPGVGLAAAVDGAVSPRATVTALGHALSSAGATADIVAFRPAPLPATAQWTTANLATLTTALAESFGTSAPPVLIDGLATPTTISPAQLGSYTGGPPPATGAVPPTTQASGYAATIRDAACSTNIVGVLLDRLVDSSTQPVPATGVYYASGQSKPSAAAVADAAAPAQRGIFVCPGVAMPAGASTVAFPQALSSGSGTSLQLGCVRDCLYLATLLGANGKPVVARRGALRGGAAPIHVVLPQAKLKPGAYVVDVRLVAQVNPGELAELTSPPLTAG